MEDRLTPELYLSLADAPMDGLAGTPGVERVTAWENLVPDRPELPRRVPEGRVLTVAEVGPGFVAPPGGVHFRRYPRPSQGCLTGRPTIGLLVVWISPKSPELAQQVRDWSDFVHLRHIAAAGVPGYTVITPYENVAGTDPRFMHFYEMDTDDPEGAYQLMPRLVAARLGRDTETYDIWADWRRAGAYLVYCNTFIRRWVIG